MDDYVKSMIWYRFGDLRKRNMGTVNGRANFLTGYLVSLEDMGHITEEELGQACADIDTWVEEEKAKVEHGNC